MAREIRIGAVRLDDFPRIVAAGGDAELEALGTAPGADLVEVRADLFDDPRSETLVAGLRALRGAGRPIIVTVRAAAEGGRPLAETVRASLYDAALPLADAIDVEIASQALIADLVPRAHAQGRTVILSTHTLDRTPDAESLLALVDRGARLGADLTKVVTYARDLEDVRTLLGVTLAARDRGIASFAMGPAGMVSRVLFSAAGSLLTYGSVGRPTAPGQLPVAELAELFRRFYRY